MPDDDPEQIKLRRWAIEMLAPNMEAATPADIARLCRAAERLIQFVLTGKLPDAESGDGHDPA